MEHRLEYGQARIKDLECRVQQDKQGKPQVAEVLVDGRPCAPTERFWTSLQARFGFSNNIFRYFGHKEVFDRISDVAPNDRVRFCVETDKDGRDQLLAVTNPSSALIRYDDLTELLDRNEAEQVTYSNGVVRSRHTPRVPCDSSIAGDVFHNRFALDVPIDAYGRPSIYLMLLRQVCSNGAVAEAPAFRSEIGVGRGNDGVGYSLERALEGFNNEEGFAALRQRFDAASRSWASVGEVNQTYKLLIRLMHLRAISDPACGSDGADEVSAEHRSILNSFRRMSGDLSEIYGLANLDSLSPKRQRALPAKCRMYDLLNFISETASHHANPVGNRRLQAHLGGLISSEYDLEGLCDQFSDFRDLFIGSEQTAEALASMHQMSRS